MNAVLLSTGDELVLGQTVDTNSAWLSRQLAAVGCRVIAHVVVGDDRDAIARALRDNLSRCDWLICTGGLGPTADDLTRDALADVMGVDLVLDPDWLAKMKRMFESRSRSMPDRNRVQAMAPRGSTLIENTSGTAPGLMAELPADKRSRRKCHVVAMPGVPREMMTMFTASVLPMIRERSGGAVVVSATLHTFGLGESAVAERLGPLMDRQRNPSVGTTVSGGIVSLRINARFPSPDNANEQLQRTIQECRAVLGSLVFGTDEQTLTSVVADMLTAGERPITVATAESCTGGWLAKLLTDRPGSSAYFKQGWVVYCNEAKQSELGVSAKMLERCGAVSDEVVTAMAQSARTQAGADVALAISGVAGPDGGTDRKPLGTVHVALAHAGGTVARRFHLYGDREMVRLRACYTALSMLRFHLLGEELPF